MKIDELQTELESVKNDYELAIGWLNKITEMLAPFCKEVYGLYATSKNHNSTIAQNGGAQYIYFLEKKPVNGYKDDQIQIIKDLCFRYEDYTIPPNLQKSFQRKGFIFNNQLNLNERELTGDKFWNCVDKIIKWLPLLAEQVQANGYKRNEIISLLR